MKEVLHCITTICSGGAENQLLMLSKAQVKSGRKVTVLFLKGIPELKDKFIAQGVEVLDILSKKNIIQQIFILRKFIRARDLIVHAHLPRAELISALSIHDQKLIISKHNIEPFFPKAPKFLSKLMSRFVSYKSTTCVAISHSVAKYLQYNGELIDARLLEVVYYGYQPRHIASGEDKSFQLQRQFNYKSKLIVGTVARLVQQKDLPTLLRAFAVINKIFVNAELHIIGEGKLEYKLKKLANNMNISEKIYWRGRATEAFTHFKEFDIFVLTSRYEGFGLVLLEAMDANIPIIAAKNSAIIEVLGDKYDNLFDTGDSDDLVVKFSNLVNYDERIKSIIHGRQRLKLFSVELMLLKMDKIYNLNS